MFSRSHFAWVLGMLMLIASLGYAGNGSITRIPISSIQGGTLGRVPYDDGTKGAYLSPNSTATRKFLRQVSSGAPAWDTLASGDIPALSYVTSVGLTVPSWLSVSGSPVTSSGTLAVTATSGLTANSFLGTPDGSTGALSVRALVAGDIPSLAASKITTGQLALARGGTNADLSATGGAGQYLKQSSSGAAITVGTIAAGDVPSGTAIAGDITGTLGATTVAKLAGNTLTTSSLSTGQYLKWNGSAWINAAGTNTTAAGSDTQIQYNSSGTLTASSDFVRAGVGQLTLTPTSTSATVLGGQMPASFAGNFFNWTDSSGNSNVQLKQLVTGQTQLFLLAATSTNVNPAVALGTGQYATSGTSLASFAGGSSSAGVFKQAGNIVFKAAENHDATHLGADLFFSVVTSGSTSNTLRLLLSTKGNVVTNGAQVALSTSATDGFLYVPTCAGLPTGTPTSYTGNSPLQWDTTNHILWFYDNGIWTNASARNNQTAVQAGNYTILATDDTVPINPPSVSGTRTGTLPLAATVAKGKRVTIINTASAGSGSGGVAVGVSGSDTFGDTNVSTAKTVGAPQVYGALTLESDGVSKWYPVSKF